MTNSITNSKTRLRFFCLQNKTLTTTIARYQRIHYRNQTQLTDRIIKIPQ